MDARRSDFAADRKIVNARILDAPRERGCVWTHVMHGPVSTDYATSTVFKEGGKPERVMQAMLQMKTVDTTSLQRAHARV